MHLTIDSFHDRFTSPEPEAFVAALRALPPIDDLSVIAPGEWGVWPTTNHETHEEGSSL